MDSVRFFWLLTLAPSLPLLLLVLAFTKVLEAKKFEVRMLLQRGETLTKYLSAYGGSGSSKLAEEGKSDQDQLERSIQKIVKQIFRLRYSFLEYVWAVLFNIAVNVLLVVLGLSFAGIDLKLPSQLNHYLVGNPYLQDVVAGGIGALLWGVYELSERYRFGDLSPDVIFVSGARVLFAGAAGAIVGVFTNNNFAWAFAFGLGVLPVSTTRTFVVERARKALNLPAPSHTQAEPSLTLLQGWNSELSEKLARAGVTSIQELACTNQFQLFLRSNLEWRVLLDLSDQALLMLYIGEDVRKLYPMGIRSAVEIAEIDWSEDDKTFFSGFSRDEAIQKIASALNHDELTVKLLIRSVSVDATVNFLGALWSEDTPDEDQTEDEDQGESEDDKKVEAAGGSAPEAKGPPLEG
jgi:hypothetical protein